MTGVRVLAPAKVNLTLRILGRRESGYHDLETLFQAVDLCDELTVTLRDEPGVALEVVGADVGPAADNLVARAAGAFLSAAPIDRGVAVRLEKRIPTGAGLGGGSSDAGATLRALDALFPGRVAPGAVLEIASALGADVAFFTGTAGLALGRGRGEVLTPLEALPSAPIVLGLPPVHVATGPAYAALARARAGEPGPPPGALFASRADVPARWSDVAAIAVNDFEPTVLADDPLVGRALAALRATGPRFALLSGSGAAVFGVYPDATAAEAATAAASAACPDVRFVSTITLAALPGLNAVGPGV